MENTKEQRILKHARLLRALIIAYTVIFVLYYVLRFGFREYLFQLVGTEFSWLYLGVLGFPITAYAIWYVLNVSPRQEHAKTNTVLSLLFLGIIGLWMTFPVENRIINRLKASQSKFQ
ncbi:MAG: hypothetical protein NWQ19_10900 [Nonlabens sp.]|nr:hypothetical protein [Nonlabens sp.]